MSLPLAHPVTFLPPGYSVELTDVPLILSPQKAAFSCTAVEGWISFINGTRAGISRADQYYASYPTGTELLTDTAKLYKAALGNCFEIDDWGPIEFSIMAKHFDRQGKPPYAYHAQYLAHLLSHGQLDGSG
ncbi:unnamed protein product [Miscanthus lutarioriparius]|uniref:Uncharacterized protein n=1 Tax=Miscanthus lutarioriparius TaxID=422564 RepID=A0A811SCN9_9POAL|nr:unnamed protein product [Miscanthus lutarioriparius]